MRRKITREEIARLHQMAAEGKTRREAAEALGLSYYSVGFYIRFHKVAFKHALEKPTLKPRYGKPRQRTRTPVGQIKAAGILDEMTMQQRSDSLVMMRKGGMSATEALRHVGRADLVEKVERIMG